MGGTVIFQVKKVEKRTMSFEHSDLRSIMLAHSGTLWEPWVQRRNRIHEEQVNARNNRRRHFIEVRAAAQRTAAAVANPPPPPPYENIDSPL